MLLIEWDEAKRKSNLRKHGVDFADCEGLFEADALTIEDNRIYYGEQRFITLGLIRDRVIAVAHTEIPHEIRIISARKRRAMNKKSTSKTSRTDWERIDAMDDEDIDFSDIPELTPEMFAHAVRRRGLKPVPRKQQVTLRLDADILDWFRAQGSGYQTKINQLLRAYVDAHRSR